MTKKERILVSGAAGFIGAHLSTALAEQGHNLYCLDNLSTGNLTNLKPILELEHVTFIEHDITSPISLELDAIYNCACPASPVQYQDNPIQTFKSSVFGTMNLLDLAKEQQCRFLQCSTSEVYGDPLEHPQQEHYWGNVNPIGPRACYDEGKRAAETLCMDYHRQYGVSIKIARIFNTYGPLMAIHDGRVISNFIYQALNNSPLTVHGDGSQSRSFCYVSDTVRALQLLMNSDDSITGPINIGNPEEITMAELATLIISLSQSSSTRQFLDAVMDDPKQRRPDIRKAKAELGFEPTISLEKGLHLSINYFRDLIDEQ